MTSPTTPAALPPIQVFRAGRHLSAGGQLAEWTAADLQELADSYDPALREAPICIGHPAGNAPAFGWIGKVQTDGSLLEAVPREAQPEFQDWVRRKLFKKVSASIYGRSHPNNPTPGKLYLRHVGFLGAQPPAVAGLADYSFADDEAAAGELFELSDWTLAQVVRSLRDWLIGKFGQDEAEKALPGWSVQALADDAVREDMRQNTPTEAAPGLSYSEGDPMSGTDLAAREAALAQRETALTAREAAAAAAATAAEQAQRTAQFSEFTDGLVREGRLLPKDKAALVSVMAVLPNAQMLEFGEGDALVKKPATEVLQDFLKSLPKVVDFSERAPAEKKPGATVDVADGVALAKAAQEFMDAEQKAGRQVSLDAAVQHVITTNQEA